MKWIEEDLPQKNQANIKIPIQTGEKHKLLACYIYKKELKQITNKERGHKNIEIGGYKILKLIQAVKEQDTLSYHKETQASWKY